MWQYTDGTCPFSLKSLQRSKWGGSRGNHTFLEVRRQPKQNHKMVERGLKAGALELECGRKERREAK